MNSSHTAPYLLLEEAAFASLERVRLLERDLSDFDPKRIVSRLPYLVRETCRIYKLNKQNGLIDAYKLVRSQVDFSLHPYVQLDARFGSRYAAEFVTSTLCVYSLIDSYINAVIACIDGHELDDGVDDRILRQSVEKKLRTHLIERIPGLEQETIDDFYRLHVAPLKNWRDALVHAKITLTVGDRAVASGTDSRLPSIHQGIRDLLEYHRIPYKLQQLLTQADYMRPYAVVLRRKEPL